MQERVFVVEIDPIISFKGMDTSPALEADIRQKIEHLEQFHNRIVSCRVVVEAPHRSGTKGKLYHVHVDVSVPGSEIVVNRESGHDHAHEDAYVALRDAFDAAKRLLEDHVRKTSGHQVKPRPMAEHGKVVRLFAEDGYGFVEMDDGREVYFSQDSVNKGGWDTIDVGAAVRLKEAEGDKGPYATSVTVLSTE